MTYAVFFPYGEPGWQPHMQMTMEGRENAHHTISMLQYKVAQTAVMEGVFNPIFHGVKLFQQWTVDS